MALGAHVRISGLKGTRSQPMSEFVLGQYSTSLASDEIILGFDIPRPDAALRWGFFKVVRKSGAFADSIAFAVANGRGGPASVVLAAAADRPCLLAKVAERIEAGDRSDDALQRAIAEDVAKHVPQDDAYLMRLHASTVLRAVREVQAK
jgi:carbon-monoxide dehydrogenase medium subunit